MSEEQLYVLTSLVQRELSAAQSIEEANVSHDLIDAHGLYVFTLLTIQQDLESLNP